MTKSFNMPFLLLKSAPNFHAVHSKNVETLLVLSTYVETIVLMSKAD